MATVTLTQLRARTRERADMVNSQFVTDTADSLDYFINTRADELYELLLQAYGDDYFVTVSTFTTTASDVVPLPSDFLKLLGVDLATDGANYRSLKAMPRYDRNRADPWDWFDRLGQGYRYRLRGANLFLAPTPSAGLAGRLQYIPQRTRLVNAADTLEAYNGWERYVILGAAIDAKLKQEDDVTQLQMELARVRDELRGLAENRDAGMPMLMTDVGEEY